MRLISHGIVFIWALSHDRVDFDGIGPQYVPSKGTPTLHCLPTHPCSDGHLKSSLQRWDEFTTPTNNDLWKPLWTRFARPLCSASSMRWGKGSQGTSPKMVEKVPALIGNQRQKPSFWQLIVRSCQLQLTPWYFMVTAGNGKLEFADDTQVYGLSAWKELLAENRIVSRHRHWMPAANFSVPAC